jgi:hypothetical protein
MNFRKPCGVLMTRISRRRSAVWALIGLWCAAMLAICGCGESLATVVVSRRAGFEVLMLPVLRGGAAGWCITAVPGGGCPIRRLKEGPIVAEFWAADGARKRAEGFVLTTSVVSAVRVSGSKPLTTRHRSSLPDGLRGIAVTVHGGWAPEIEVPGLFSQPPHKAPAGLPHFTPLNAAGSPLAQNDGEGPLVERELAGRSWHSPASAPSGPCELYAGRLAGLVTKAGFVLGRANAVKGLIGDPFLSCASTSYSLKGWPMVSSVLVDARRPGAKPGLLPEMRAVADSFGVFRALGSNGPMVARRIPGAWLVVSGGRGELQRRMLLNDLRVEEKLP